MVKVILLAPALLLGVLPGHAGAQAWTEVTDSIQVPGTRVEWVKGSMIAPETPDRIRCVIVLLARGVSSLVYESGSWRKFSSRERCPLVHLEVVGRREPTASIAQQVIRNAGIGGADGVVRLLHQFGRRSGRAEMDSVPIIIWGFSAAGSFAVTFAALHPDRTLGFIRYHSHLRNLSFEVESAAKVPGLIVAGEDDAVAGVTDSENFWQSGREQGAPWLFVLEPGLPHYPEEEAFERSSLMMLSWVQTILRLRELK